jgi:hypothetical protein
MQTSALEIDTDEISLNSPPTVKAVLKHSKESLLGYPSCAWWLGLGEFTLVAMETCAFTMARKEESSWCVQSTSWCPGCISLNLEGMDVISSIWRPTHQRKNGSSDWHCLPDKLVYSWPVYVHGGCCFIMQVWDVLYWWVALAFHSNPKF